MLKATAAGTGGSPRNRLHPHTVYTGPYSRIYVYIYTHTRVRWAVATQPLLLPYTSPCGTGHALQKNKVLCIAQSGRRAWELRGTNKGLLGTHPVPVPRPTLQSPRGDDLFLPWTFTYQRPTRCLSYTLPVVTASAVLSLAFSFPEQ